MSQSKIIQVPAPLHAQLKALAAKRKTTMVNLIHGIVREAIANKDLDDETPGLKATLFLDMDAEDHGPFVRVTTPMGDLPLMTRDDAEAVARNLAEIEPGSDVVRNRLAKGGQVAVSYVGTGIEIVGKAWDADRQVRAVLTVAFARDFAWQLRAVAQKAVPDAE